MGRAVSLLPARGETVADEVVRPAVYEHPWAVRFCHWANAVSMLVLAMSGLQIFNAFPSFGAEDSAD